MSDTPDFKSIDEYNAWRPNAKCATLTHLLSFDMSILAEKTGLAIRIMILTFTMENLLKLSPNGHLSQLSQRQVNEYIALEREKLQKIEQLREVMLNDRDIATG